MKNNIINYFVPLYLSISLYYGSEFLVLYFTDLVIYILIWIIFWFLLNPKINDILKRSFKFKSNNSSNLQVHFVLSIILICFYIVNYNRFTVSDLYVLSVEERFDRAGSNLPIYLKYFVVLSGTILAGQESYKCRFIGITQLTLNWFLNGFTSRGSLIMLLAMSFGRYKLNVKGKIFYIVIAIFITLLSIDIKEFRGSKTSAYTGIPHYINDGYVSDKNHTFLFFIPSFLKGERIATNIKINEQTIANDSYYYVHLFGDFGTMLLGYGDYWFLYYLYNICILTVILQICIKYTSNLILVLLACMLFGARVSIEVLIIYLYYSFLLPIILIEFITRLKLYGR